MNYQNLPQENKAELLEQAVLNETSEQLAETYRELGHIEMTARALGIACRFCGVGKVKTLVECGATFDIPRGEEAERRYHCYSGMKYDNYRSNYALYLLKIFKQIKGACCCKGLKLVKQAAANDKKYLSFLSDGERVEVLRYLCENKDKLSFYPSEMLYYAIFVGDTVIVDELKRLGAELSDTRVQRLTCGGPATDSYWYEWVSMMGKLSDEDYLPVMKRLTAELGGKRFHCTSKVYDITKKRFANAEIVEFFNDNFKTDRLNKTDIIRSLIDYNSVNALPFAEKLGWLDNPKRRDEMIEYAQKTGKIECTAWLLDFKNRTADIAAEQAKAEKKMLAELNASPTSVAVMKKTWSYKKQEDGTLMLTSYKGGATEVTVPERIGKSTVTAIGVGAFSANSGGCGGMVRSSGSYLQQNQRRTITRLILPQTLKYIGASAFAHMFALEEIEIPDGVAEIDGWAFYFCKKLKKVVIPGTSKRILMYAFAHCEGLRGVEISDGVEEIGECAFMDCTSLESVRIPASVKLIHEPTNRYSPPNIFSNCPKLTVYCPRGSYAEEYCKTHNIKFAYR